MKKRLLVALAAAVLFFLNPFTSVVFGADAETELKALVTKVNDDIKAGKRTEAALADDLKQFDVLLAEHQGEKTDAVARILYMQAMLYAEVLDNPTKADQLMKQLKSDFQGTAFVTKLQQHEEQQKAAQKIQAGLVPGAAFPDFSEKDVDGKPFPSPITKARWCWWISGRRGAGRAAVKSPMSWPPTANITAKALRSSGSAWTRTGKNCSIHQTNEHGLVAIFRRPGLAEQAGREIRN